MLCVDDEPNCVSALHRFFRKYHVRFSSAYNAIQAFRRITDKKPDLIICDVMMPAVRGTEMLDWLRGNVIVRDIPLIILTGHGGDEIRTEAMASGANGFLQKPVLPETLEAEIEQFIPLIRRRRARSDEATAVEAVG
ncbi:MAG: response regulator [Pirellulales bacterium]|nr:response regulator [Pirellulales bacterium]